ncbi:sulfotransferase domain-containing protein [Parasphingopyxis marina]|uniref:Sulfotransferase domain-containing protein n=1 Tax=Parasphingopyxis marina TaxID=2761622 RepID=A0A842HYZ2_9SPHN|nr:sulfotransferase domain-containing protein [Parasphingopyxis marina]MBC2777150.1 sulfotransferase domain-containing protein [Parasphingopyxis marina]
MQAQIEWPVKRRELHNHHMDSTVWNDFVFRDDDIVIGTYAKSGTTWLQQIVGQLLFRGDEDVPVADLSPWVDLRAPPKAEKLAMIEAQTNRRFLKTHLPVDALVFSPKAKYLYVARDGRDVVWSFHNHWVNASDFLYEMVNDTPGLVGPPMPRLSENVHDVWREWIENDGAPFWAYWENIRSWWDIRDLPNVKLLHFSHLKADLEGQMRAIADFLEIAIEEELWPVLLEHCSFDYMKINGDKAAPLGGMPWEGGGKTFINKGVNGRWRDILTQEECEEYERRAREELGESCAHWLKTGEGA